MTGEVREYLNAYFDVMICMAISLKSEPYHFHQGKKMMEVSLDKIGVVTFIPYKVVFECNNALKKTHVLCLYEPTISLSKYAICLYSYEGRL